MSTRACPSAVLTIGILLALTSVPAASEQEKCMGSLGMEDGRITDAMIMTSSNRPGTNKTGVRYNCCTGKSEVSWCPNKKDSSVWVDVTFPRPTGVSAIAIQFPSGVPDPSKATDYLKTYHLAYKLVGRPNMEYFDDKGKPANFTGITDKFDTVRESISPVVMEKLRIEVVTSEGEACFRFELYGCDQKVLCPEGCDNGHCLTEDTCLCDKGFKGKFCEEPVIPASSCHSPLGMETGNITADQLEVSSSKPGKGKEKARWNCCTGEDVGAWCPADDDKAPYYQVSWKKPVRIGTIGIDFPARKQLGVPITEYMKTYQIEYHQPGSQGPIHVGASFTAANSTTTVSTTINPIVTDRLRILPKSFEKSPCFRFELYSCDTKDQCPLGCKNDGTCVGPNICHCKPGFFGVDCRYTKTQIQVNLQVTLTFELIVGTVLVTPAYNLSLHGHPQLVEGRLGKALYLNGNSQFMEIKRQNMGCLATVGRCQSGFTLSMDINFVTIEEGMYVFSSGGDGSKSSGVTCRVHQSHFEVTVSTSTKIWQGSFPVQVVETHKWTKFEYSWSVTEGLYVYLNNGHTPVVKVPQPTGNRPQPVYVSHSLVFGSSSMKTSTVSAHYIIENVKTWSISKNSLVDSGVIDVKCPDGCLNKGTCTPEGVCKCGKDFEGKLCEIKKNMLTQYNLTFVPGDIHEAKVVSGVWKVEGGPKFLTDTEVGVSVNIVTSKHHLILEPRPTNPCLSDINLCFKGLTYHMDLNIQRYAEFTYFVSNGGDKAGDHGVAFYYAIKTLHVCVTTSTHMWSVTFPSLPRTKVWHTVEYSWSHAQGLTVYLNNYIIGTCPNGTEAEVSNNHTYPIRIGTPSYVIDKGENPSFQIANLQIWLVTRLILEKFSILPGADLPVPTTTVTEAEYVTTKYVPKTMANTGPSKTTGFPTTKSSKTTETPTIESYKTTGSPTIESQQTTLKLTQPGVSAQSTAAITQSPHTAHATTSQATVTTETLPVSTEQSYIWKFASLKPNQISVVHKDMNLTLKGGAKMVTVDSFRAIHFQSTSATHRYLQFNTQHRSCLNDASLCTKDGFTLSFKIKFTLLEENTYIISSGGENPLSTGMAIIYRFGRLQFVFSQNHQAWYCHSPRPHLNTWTTIDLTWHKDSGLEVYYNNALVDQFKTPVIYSHKHNTFVHKQFYFASSTIQTKLAQNFVGYLASFSTWFLSRSVLVQKGILKPATTTPSPTSTTKAPMTPSPTTTKVPMTPSPTTTKAPMTPSPTTTKAPTTPSPTTTKAPTTSSPTTTTKVPSTKAPTTTSLAVTTAGELVCPTGCIKKVGKPQRPEKPILKIEEPPELQGNTYFVCKFTSSQQANLLHVVRWSVDGKELPMSKQMLKGTSSEARLDPAQLSGTLLGRKICCSVQDEFSSVCGGKYSEQVVSNCITPKIKLLTPKLTVHEGAGTGKIQVNITVPPSALCSVETGRGCEVRILATLVASSHDKKHQNHALPEVVFLPHLSGSRYHSCGASFVNTNWKHVMEIELKATIDGVYDRTQYRQIQLAVKIIGVTALPLIQIGVVQVTVIDEDRRALCSSVGDPHITTFDGQRYNNYVSGEMIMYKHKSRPYEVHAQLMRCNPRRARPTCNCGIAVRAGDDVITLSRCDVSKHDDDDDHHHHHEDPHHHHEDHHHSSQSMALQLYMNGALTSGTTVRRIGCGQKYEVYLPTGTKITVQTVSRSFINFWITPSAADRNSVSGLCGTYNSARGDDYTGPGGILYSKAYRTREPDTYINSWRVSDSIFTGVAVRREEEQQRFCHCYNPEHAPCGISYDITRYTSSSAYDITAELVKQARAPRLMNRHRRAAPNTAASGTTDTSCTNSSWSLPEAKAYCKEYLDNSTAAMRCDGLFNLSSDTHLNNCAQDLQCTDDIVYARSMLDDIISNCVEEIQKQGNTSQGNKPADTDLADLVKQLCVEDCQNGGACLQGVCVCAAGFTGVDCSIGKNSTPIVDPIPMDGEPCDIQGDQCQVAPVTGEDFVDSQDLKCELTYVQVSDSLTSSSQPEVVNATYMDISRVNCPVYRTESVKVKVTNNGRVFSQTSYLHVVYDSKCSNCRLDRSTNTANCQQKVDVCRIAEKCYTNGETKTGDQCAVCDTASTKSAWSRSKGCGQSPNVTPASQAGAGGLGRTGKIIIGVVCGVGGLGIIFAVVYILKRRSRGGKHEELSSPPPIPHTVELHRERTDMIKPVIYTNQAFKEESIRS